MPDDLNTPTAFDLVILVVLIVLASQAFGAFAYVGGAR